MGAAIESPHDPTALARRLLLAVAVLAVVGAVLALVLVQRFGSTYRDGLTVTRDGAAITAANTGLARTLVDEMAELASATAATVDEAIGLLGTAVEMTEGVGATLGSDLAEAVQGTANIANGTARLVETIERFIPGNTQSLAEELRTIADSLAPMPDELRALGAELRAASVDVARAAVRLSPVVDRLEALASGIRQAGESIAEVDVLARDLAVRAEAALDRSSLDLWLLRVLTVVVGAGAAAVAVAARRVLGLRAIIPA